MNLPCAQSNDRIAKLLATEESLTLDFTLDGTPVSTG
jgi:hypothetical protein